MPIYLTFILFTFSHWVMAQEFSPKLNKDKFTVCAITLNSKDEREIFSSQMKKFPETFNPIVELTQFSSGNNWFKKACESGIRCDQLVISGHFSGNFFGENEEKTLDLKELEEAGCSKTCEGILSDPHEVFLFGCNTLATKAKDGREANYFNILLNDGFSRAEAAQRVEARYGETGDSNKDAMRRAFSGKTKTLYGFDSAGPTGAHIRPKLENYFAKFRDPNAKPQVGNQIKRVTLPEYVNDLANTRATKQTYNLNKNLKDSLSGTAFDQCSTGELSDEAKKICALHDSNISTAKKVDLAAELLASPDFLIHLPAVNYFIDSEMKKIQNLPLSDRGMKLREFQSLLMPINGGILGDTGQENKHLKSQLMALVAKTDILETKNNWLTLSSNLGFITEAQKKKIFTEAVLDTFKDMNITSLGSICDLHVDNLKIDAQSIARVKNQTPETLKLNGLETVALSCLGLRSDPGLTKVVVAGLTSELKKTITPQNKQQIENNLESYFVYLREVEHGDVVIPPAAFQKAKLYLNSPNVTLMNASTTLMANYEPQDPAFKTVLNSQLYSTNVDKNYTALQSYQILGVIDDKTKVRMIEMAKTSKDSLIPGAAIQLLVNDGEATPAIKKLLQELLKSPSLREEDKDILQGHPALQN